jgi:hypothetical protein
MTAPGFSQDGKRIRHFGLEKVVSHLEKIREFHPNHICCTHKQMAAQCYKIPLYFVKLQSK